MKRIVFLAFACCAFTLFSGSALATDEPAPPVSALFYPNEIYLTVEERLVPEPVDGKSAGLRIVLPAAAVRPSFSATVDGSPANSFYWLDASVKPAPQFRPLPGDAPKDPADPRRTAVLETIKTIQGAIDEKNASLNARQTRLNLWQKVDPKDEKFSLDDILKLDSALAERLADLHAADTRDKRDMDELRHKLDAAQAELRRIDTVTVRNVAVIPAPDTGKPVLVRYSYIMPGSSSSSYRVTAYPSRETLAIEQEATLFQGSGQVWKDVDVYISTTRRDTTLRPAALAPWRISFNPPEPVVMAERAAPRAPMAQMAQLDIRKEARTVHPAPAQAEMGTFRLWSLGKKTIDSGVAVTLPLAKDEYTASYYYTLQPSVNPKGFLTAFLDLEKALELPQGKARLFVDNVSVGEQNLAVNGNTATLFFGSDPQVTAVMRDLKRSTGEKGIISKEQSVLWHWEITVRNGRSRPVEAWVMDPLPDEQDTAIKVVSESKPKPETAASATQLGATRVYRWKFTLQPGETQVIDHTVRITAPADKPLNPGRGR